MFYNSTRAECVNVRNVKCHAVERIARILATHVVKIAILGCPRGSSVNWIQIAGLITVSSILVNVGLVTSVIRHIDAVAIVVSAAGRDLLLGKRKVSRQAQVTDEDVARGDASYARHHIDRPIPKSKQEPSRTRRV